VIPTRRDGEGVSFEIAVQSRDSRAAIEGAARRGAENPPEGAANKQCIELLAKALSVPKSKVVIVSGAGSKRKRVRIHHDDLSAIEGELAALISKAS
jgi:uncharacterized protein YggU (UPF0235/DUF167 family)